MGEAKRKLSAKWAGRAHLLDGEMQIVRFKNGATHRVEFYLNGLSNEDAYAAIANIKRSFEERLGFSDPARPNALSVEPASGHSEIINEERP